MSEPALRIGPREFRWGSRTYVMGIVNLSPDSFAGDGAATAEAAVERARRAIAEGADIIDLGPESTRPGGEPIGGDEAWHRLEPVLEALAGRVPVPISVDTYHPEVAGRALSAGADIVNDVWGLRADCRMAEVIAAAGAACVLMHNQRGREKHGVVSTVLEGFRESLRISKEAGIARERIILDPGFGFGWEPHENLEMLRKLERLHMPGIPLLVGTSRKSTIGHVLDLPVEERLEGTAATVAIAIANGADIVRVHDVKEMVRVARMADAIVRE